MGKQLTDRLRRVSQRLRRPERFGNWLRARSERTRRPELLRSFPLGIDLEPTTRCNLRCQACQQNEGDWTPNDLSVERLERLLDQLPHLEQIKFQGMGEPLLHDRFGELVARIKRRRVRVYTITNGTTLHIERCRRDILASGLDELLVSIDGATPATHARTRGNSDLDRIVYGLKRLVELRGHARSPRLGIWCVGNARNIAELPALVEIAAAIGADELFFQTQLASWGKAAWDSRLAPLRLNPESAEALRHLEEAGREARRRRFTLTIHEGNRFSARRPCFWPWESCFISAAGFVTRCCIASDPRLHNFGQIETADFRAIWNSAEYRELRRAFRENRIPPLCRGCYEAG